MRPRDDIMKFRPADMLNVLADLCHRENKTWWLDPETGEKLKRNKGEMIALMHSELSEMLEAERKDLMDEKLPHRKGAEVELVDVFIRAFDYAGAYGFDLTGAFLEKMEYNRNRADHKPENRIKEGGKKF